MEILKRLLGFVDIAPGKKTYILSGLAVVTIALNLFGVLDGEATLKVLTVLGFGQAGTITARVVRGG